ncbi:MAG: hypothetical protein ACWA47_10470 [Brevirhabdus sp.]
MKQARAVEPLEWSVYPERMERADITKMADEIAKAMGDKLGARGRGLKGKLRHSGRILPAEVRAAAKAVLEAEKYAGSPKLAKRIDPVALGHAKHTCLNYLTNIDTSEATKKAIADYASGLALNILMLAVLIVAILVWRGFL